MTQVSGGTQLFSRRFCHRQTSTDLSICHNLSPQKDRLQLLCPVRALRAYVAATASIRRSDQLFLRYGGPRRGCALSKQRLSHWVVDTIIHASKEGSHPLPSGVRCHSTRAVSTSWAAGNLAFSGHETLRDKGCVCVRLCVCLLTHTHIRNRQV